YTLLLEEGNATTLALRTDASRQRLLHMTLDGARANARMIGERPLPSKIYYVPPGATGSLNGRSTYGRVRDADVYRGIDLLYYVSERQLEFDFVVAPHADPSAIQLSFSGADSIRINRDGELVLIASGDEVRL